MSRITLTCHRKVNFIACICGYVGTYHICDLAINGIITIYLCHNDSEVCQKKIIFIVDSKRMKTATLSVECPKKSQM